MGRTKAKTDRREKEVEEVEVKSDATPKLRKPKISSLQESRK